MAVGQSGNILRLVSPQELYDQDRLSEEEQLSRIEHDAMTYDGLAAYVRTEWQHMRNWRSTEKINKRLLDAIRTFKGVYSPQKVMSITQFGGSTVYARLVAVKCRGATSLLRDIYLSADKAWGVEPTPEPSIPDNVIGDVQQLLQQELQQAQQMGLQITEEMIVRRQTSLMMEALKREKKFAETHATKIETSIDDLFVEGGFYEAMAEFLVDLPIFPFAIMKGPVVQIVPDVVWENGRAVVRERPKMFWKRVNPFDMYWSPGVSKIAAGAAAEKIRYTRTDLNALLGLPGYNEDNLRAVLRDYGGGLRDWLDETDSERADFESREDPSVNQSEIIDGMEYHGPVQGQVLLDYGMPPDMVPDPERDYFCQIWQIGNYVIKAQISPSPRKRHPYFITSYEKVPGTIVGNGLPDILNDMQEVCNASIRALVNNLSISSGPQVVVNEERLAPTEDGNSLYPWKRWRVTNDPMGSSGNPPVHFFQPQSNASELLQVYEKFNQMADDISAIPRYVTGSERLGGAGRTASGLAMLMGNAAKVLQNVAANIDGDVLTPLLSYLYDMLLLTDTQGKYRGDENVRVRGVAVAIQKETERQRQLEFLQLTSNPTDLEIVGLRGRGSILRNVSNELGMPGDDIVPSDEELEVLEMKNKLMKDQQEMQQRQQPQQGGAPGGAQGGAQGAGQQQPQAGPLQGPQTNTVGQRPMPPGPPQQGGAQNAQR